MNSDFNLWHAMLAQKKLITIIYLIVVHNNLRQYENVFCYPNIVVQQFNAFNSLFSIYHKLTLIFVREFRFESFACNAQSTEASLPNCIRYTTIIILYSTTIYDSARILFCNLCIAMHVEQ